MVKLGGSLMASPVLRDWLDVLAASTGAVVVVPGGGPFADAVRAAQAALAFDDGVAHRLALLAMEQYGLMLAGIEPALRPAASRRAIARLRAAGSVPVWMPTRMALGSPDIAESWDVTSDSLAAWLARVLGAARLVLVKSAAPPPGRAAAADLVASGLVDAALPGFLARAGCPCWCIGPDGAAALAAALRDGAEAGTRIELGA